MYFNQRLVGGVALSGTATYRDTAVIHCGTWLQCGWCLASLTLGHVEEGPTLDATSKPIPYIEYFKVQSPTRLVHSLPHKLAVVMED
jgi:hypothetical protein